MNSAQNKSKQELSFTDFVLKRDLPEPLYLQMARQLEKRICEHSSREKIHLPSVLRLSEILNADRTTVRKAYDLLLKEHRIEYVSQRKIMGCPNKKKPAQAPFPNIGIILPFPFTQLIESSYGMPLEYFKGISDSALEHNVSITMMYLPNTKASAEEIERYNNQLAGRVTGIIHLGDRNFRPDPPLEALAADDRIPQVMISMHSKRANIGSIVSDPVPAARALAEQFRILHHKHIGMAYLMQPASDRHGFFNYEAERRPSIIRKVFREYGLYCSEAFDCTECSSSNIVYRQLLQKKRAGTLPTAYWCANDNIALYMMEAFAQLGLRVPEDISVIGYDGIYSCAEKAEITTMSLPFYRIGYQAVKLLDTYLRYGISDKNRLMRIQATLVMRKTLAKCAGIENSKLKLYA